jgi:hypothetical protein
MAAGKPVTQPSRSLRLAVAGRHLADEIARHKACMPGIILEASFSDLHELSRVDADALVLEWSSLHSDTASTIDRLRRVSGVDHVVVVYSYAPLAAAERLCDDRTAVMRLPLLYGELARTVRALLAQPAQDRNATPDRPPAFTREQLARVARFSRSLECECPRHTAEIIRMLTDFEDYSLECEQNEPAEAFVHRMLRREAAAARQRMETALAELARFQQIPLNGEDHTGAESGA